MKKLNLKIMNNVYLDSYFLIDGKKPKFKNNEFKNRVFTYETDRDEVEVRIYEWNDYKNSWWFALSIFYFIISVFGIFDIRQDKRFRSIDCEFKVKLDKEENNVTLVYNGFKENDIAVVHESDCQIEVSSNKYCIDTISKKRYKIMKWVKLLIWVIFVTMIILFLR